MNLDDLGIARLLHVLAIVLWIGGLGFVTTVVLPTAAELPRPEDRALLFERLERRFSWIARGAILVAGISGFYMVAKFQMWDRFHQLSFWWMHAMVALWAIFTLLLFVAEPFWLHRLFASRMRHDPDHALRTVLIGHWILLLLSVATIGAAVAGAHGYLTN